MKHLSKLLPAETILLLEGENASWKELLKVTLIDLLLRQVLEVKTISKKSNGRDRVRYFKYIVRGKNFLKHKPSEHELIYLSPYAKSRSLEILFRHLIQIGFQNSKSEKKYVSSIRQSPAIDHYFSKNIFQKIFGGFSITGDGAEIRNKIKVEIAQLEKELPLIINSDKEKASQIVNTIGGNIFLFKNFNFPLLSQIDSEILAEIKRREKNNQEGGCYGCSWETDWGGFDGLDCSSCSSCSGCSGCGSD